MALHFSFEKTSDPDRLSTHPGDPEKWHPVGDTLVWLSMPCGFNHIKKENVDHIWKRINLYQIVNGANYNRLGSNDKPEGLFLTKRDVEAYVGMWTNASAKTDARFLKDLYAQMARNDDESKPTALETMDRWAKEWAAHQAAFNDAKAASKAAEAAELKGVES